MQEGLKPSHLTLLLSDTLPSCETKPLRTPTLPTAQAEPLHPENQWQRAQKPRPPGQSPTGGHSKSFGASPRQRGRAWVRQLGPIQTPTCHHHTGKCFVFFFLLFNSRSVLQHPLLPNQPFSLLPPLSRDGDGWSWLWGAEGTAWVTGTRGGRGALAAQYIPSPPLPTPQEQRRGLTWPPAKMTGELDGLGRYGMVTPFGGDWVTGREGRSDTESCWH